MAIMNKKQSEQLDEIIKAALIDFQKMRTVDDINNYLFNNETYDYCLSLYYKLYNYYPEIIKRNSSPDLIMLVEDYAKAFIHDGGFTKLYNEAASRQELEDARQKLNDEKLSAEVDIVKFQKGLGKKLTIWGVAISAIAIIVSILTTVVTDSKKDNQTLPFDTLYLKTQLQNIETRIKTLESKQVKDTPTKK